MGKRWPGRKLPSAKLSVQTVTRSEHTRENKKMNLEDEIRLVLFKIGQELKVHRLDGENLIVEIDYEKYVSELKSILGGYTGTP